LVGFVKFGVLFADFEGKGNFCLLSSLFFELEKRRQQAGDARKDVEARVAAWAGLNESYAKRGHPEIFPMRKIIL